MALLLGCVYRVHSVQNVLHSEVAGSRPLHRVASFEQGRDLCTGSRPLQRVAAGVCTACTTCRTLCIQRCVATFGLSCNLCRGWVALWAAHAVWLRLCTGPVRCLQKSMYKAINTHLHPARQAA